MDWLPDADDFRPAGDPAVIERGAQAWSDLADVLQSVEQSIAASVRTAQTTWTGPSADAFAAAWASTSKSLSTVSDQMAEAASGLEGGVDACRVSNATYITEVAIFAPVAQQAIASVLVMNSAGIVPLPAAQVIAAEAVVQMLKELQGLIITLAAGAIESAFVAAVTVICTSTGAPEADAGAAPAAGGAGAAIDVTGAVVKQSVTWSARLAAACCEAFVGAMIELAVTMTKELAIRTIAYGDPTEGWTAKDVGAIGIETGISLLPVGFASGPLLKSIDDLALGAAGTFVAKESLELGTELAQNLGTSLTVTAFQTGGDVSSVFTTESLLGMGVDLVAGKAGGATGEGVVDSSGPDVTVPTGSDTGGSPSTPTTLDPGGDGGGGNSAGGGSPTVDVGTPDLSAPPPDLGPTVGDGEPTQPGGPVPPAGGSPTGTTTPTTTTTTTGSGDGSRALVGTGAGTQAPSGSGVTRPLSEILADRGAGAVLRELGLTPSFGLFRRSRYERLTAALDGYRTAGTPADKAKYLNRLINIVNDPPTKQKDGVRTAETVLKDWAVDQHLLADQGSYNILPPAESLASLARLLGLELGLTLDEMNLKLSDDFRAAYKIVKTRLNLSRPPRLVAIESLLGYAGDDSRPPPSGPLKIFLEQLKSSRVVDKHTFNLELDERFAAGGTGMEQFSPKVPGWPAGSVVNISGNTEYRNKVKEMLNQIGETEVGKKLFSVIGGTGFPGPGQPTVVLTIQPPKMASIGYGAGDIIYYNNSAAGTSVAFDCDNFFIGKPEDATAKPYRSRDPIVGLFHELVHVYIFTLGGDTFQDGNLVRRVGSQGDEAELRIVGIPCQHGNDTYCFDNIGLNPVTENQFRKEYAQLIGADTYYPRFEYGNVPDQIRLPAEIVVLS